MPNVDWNARMANVASVVDSISKIISTTASTFKEVTAPAPAPALAPAPAPVQAASITAAPSDYTPYLLMLGAAALLMFLLK